MQLDVTGDGVHNK